MFVRAVNQSLPLFKEKTTFVENRNTTKKT